MFFTEIFSGLFLTFLNFLLTTINSLLLSKTILNNAWQAKVLMKFYTHLI
jgi:hypothetical protein